MANSTSKSVANFLKDQDQLPAHLAKDAGLGNENVGTDDLAIPRIDLIQQLSPQIDKQSPKYIEGAETGHLFNSLSGNVHDFIFVINLQFEQKWQIFKKRKFGGGFEGSFDSEADATAHLDAQGLPHEQYDVVDTAIHKCLMLDENGNPDQPVLIYMSGSKQRVSKNWNTAIQLKNPNAARFASVWTLQSVGEKNKQGQPYFNFKVDFAGWAGEDLYAEAKRLYEGLVSGGTDALAKDKEADKAETADA
ncbi:hypothetical protein [Vreelandella massiliensis]|uniref:hypothetical protein n=1 Tax=Vreelandella massiliensis TaxID=1816686 RepID=UPI00096AB916|nr:hypothetical protein [Halomonas massiliensis]